MVMVSNKVPGGRSRSLGNHLGSAWFLAIVFGLFLTGSTLLPSIATASKRPPNVILIKGFADVFSSGLDEISRKLQGQGVSTIVVSHRQSSRIIELINESRQSNSRRPIILIGHSLGANRAIRIAHRLKPRGIGIRQIISLGATAPPDVPTNVSWLRNYYFKSGGWGELVNKTEGFRGKLENIDLSTREEVGHFNMDENADLQQEIVNLVARFRH